jgi:hypothetical protein
VYTSKNGSRNIADLPHINGPRTVSMECNDKKVDALITEDCIVMVKECRR